MIKISDTWRDNNMTNDDGLWNENIIIGVKSVEYDNIALCSKLALTRKYAQKPSDRSG